MKKEAKTDLVTLKVDGGATANHYLMQFQSDILECSLKLPLCLETTALGAAYLSGLTTGFWKNCEEIQKIHSYQAIYEPSMDRLEINRRYKGWKKAVASTRTFR